MLKKFLSLLAVILFFNLAVTSAAPIDPVIDNAKVLKPTEVELLNQRIRDVEHKHKIKIGVVFVKSVGNKDMITASDELRDEYFSNGRNGGIVLLVAMDKRKYEIATDNRMVQQITNSDGIPYLKDAFQSELSSGNYYGAVNNFVAGVSELVSYYELHGTPYGAMIKPQGLDPIAGGGALIVAIFLGVMIRSMLIGSMSNVHHAMAALDYLKKNTVNINESRDTFLFMNVRRRPRGGGSSSGGGHRGGGGGGGSF